MNTLTFHDITFITRFFVPSTVSRKIRLQKIAEYVGKGFNEMDSETVKDLYMIIVDNYDKMTDKYDIARNTKIINKIFNSVDLLQEFEKKNISSIY